MLPKKVFLSLGSNLGNRKKNLTDALQALEAESIHLLACSSIYETEPQDVADQPWFLNIAVEAESTFSPSQLLAIVQQVERRLGRIRNGLPPRGPRSIDIDILLYEREVIAMEELEIPHPRLCERRFVLEPLLEIAPELRNPAKNKALKNYLRKVRGQKVTKLDTICPQLHTD